jgi:hypothetical protein
MRRRRGGVARTVGRTAVVAGTATAVAGGVGRRQSKKQAAQQEEQAAAQQTAYDQGQADAQPSPPAATPAAGDDMMSQLEKLGQLHDQGVLTDAEFEAQKAKLLAG